jgi:hypothetical protein
MPNKPFAFALFLSSYSPAFLILAVRAIDRSYALFVVSLTLAVGSSGLFLLFIRFARAGAPYKAEILEVEPHDADLAAYVATYLLPFIVVFGASAQDVVALGLFLFFIGVLWVNSGMVYLNPLLALRGYHVYLVQLGTVGATPSGRGTRSFLLSQRRELRTADIVRADTIASNVLIDLDQSSSVSEG